jgi:rhamnosyltransferase
MEASSTNHLHPKNHGICAVVITHNPDEKFLILLHELERQVNQIIVVDNHSSKNGLAFIQKARQSVNFTLIKNAENKGVAAALNQGFAKAQELAFEWVITFDQDSEPNADMVEKLWRLLQDRSESSKIAIVAPKIIDADLERSSLFLRKKTHLLYERVECDQSHLEDVTTVITTGAMVRIAAYEVLGGFREELFIDYVDTDFCLRLLLHGYCIWVACDAHLNHTFGRRRKIQMGPLTFYPTFHPHERWYTISRNRIQMIKSYGFQFPHWLFYEMVASSYIIFRMFLTEDKKLSKMSALIKGSWDGLRGRLGKPYWALEQTNTTK